MKLQRLCVEHHYRLRLSHGQRQHTHGCKSRERDGGHRHGHRYL
ncbi:MAG: hypothetical protein AB7P76_12170 [Candidatus Melainabacteria bacterium]